MLPSFYQEIPEKYLSSRQLITLKMLVWVLQTQKEVRIERLAANLPLPIQENSRHIQYSIFKLYSSTSITKSSKLVIVTSTSENFAVIFNSPLGDEI